MEQGIKIEVWKDISSDYTNCDILLGNGFSINIWDKLNYNSLFDEFMKQCPPEMKPAFQKFYTSNFEFILDSLGRAIEVGEAFDLDYQVLSQAVDMVRVGLIRSVESVHPRANELPREHLSTISTELTFFNDIYTTNYDCLLYILILLIKDLHLAHSKIRPYNDYFWEEYDGDYLKFMDFQNYSKYKHVYYLHGALFLFRRSYTDVKVRNRRGSQLIHEIATSIQSGNIPLFVSEGSSQEKQEAISRSEYLRFAQKNLSKQRDNLLIYGFALGDSDKHIAETIDLSTNNVVYALHVGDKKPNEIYEEQLHVMKMLSSTGVKFIDAGTLFNK